MGGDASEPSRRAWLASVVVLALSVLPHGSELPQLRPEQLAELERRFWESLLADVASVLADASAPIPAHVDSELDRSR